MLPTDSTPPTGGSRQTQGVDLQETDVSKQMKGEDGQICERCEVVVDCGQATATYRWAGMDVDGHETIDDDVTEWSEGEIRDMMADMIGIEEGRDLISVEYA